MEVIRDGILGDVTPSQAEFLQAAMTQCEYIDSLIGELSRAERLRSGTPRVRRVATKRTAIRDAVDLSTRSLLSNKQIDLHWDGAEPNSIDTLVDSTRQQVWIADPDSSGRRSESRSRGLVSD